MTPQPRTAAACTLLLALFLCGAYLTFADPSGASIVSNSTAGQPSSTPDSRNDSGGTITTMILSSLQQDNRWKAYVGNVSGYLSLDDATGNTIYDWNVGGTASGELYVTRHASVAFGNITCITDGNISSESAYMNMTLSQQDGVNKTFNYTSHQAITIGTIPPVSLGANSCRSTATYVNDSRQAAMDGTQLFQEVLTQDSSSRVVYITILNNDQTGFNNRTYDFQIIVPENPVNLSQTVYYFFTELS